MTRLPRTLVFPFIAANGWCFTACGGVLRAVGLGVLAPMDSATAVGVAERNLCGRAVPSTDSICVLVGVDRHNGQYVVTLDRNPPAGNDRVNVTVTNGGGVEVEQVARPRTQP